MADSEPDAYRELRDPREIKAFADPLRLRILHVLLDRQATNQQVAAALGETPAKVFHHLHFLLDAGLIRLVDTRISGKNVEKFYRAVARGFLLRPDADLLPETRIPALGAELDRQRHDALESAAVWEDEPPRMTRRMARLDSSQLKAFEEGLHRLIRQHWVDTPGQGNDTPRAVLSVLTYRQAPESPAEPEQTAGESPDA